jgi:hypothetical protein
MRSLFFKQILPLLIIIVVAFAVHELLFYSLNIDTKAFHYTLPQLYACFTFFSMIVVMVLLLVKRKSLDNVGMSFLLITSVKMFFCYLVLRPILKTTTLQNSTEKINFFALFIFFLLMETLFTIRLVNEKKK